MKSCLVLLLVVYGSAWMLSCLQDISYSKALAQVYFIVFTAWVNYMMPYAFAGIGTLFVVVTS